MGSSSLPVHQYANMKQQIGIIGAGISGLATAKAFLQAGYEVTILEKSSGLGGVWNVSRSYTGVATQTTRDEYAFSDFPMPASYPLWPSGQQVQQYLEAYADHFGIRPHILFETGVEDLRFDGNCWQVVVRRRKDGAPQTLSFHFVAVCTGTFHEPHLPEIPGMEDYKAAGGQVLHSSQVRTDMELMNKNVAVVGFAKSATDIACRAAEVGSSCTLVYRKAQWKVPRFFGGKVNMKYLLFSRFSEAFFNAPDKTPFQRVLHSVGRPMVWLQWRGLEALLKKQFRLKECGMVPTHRIEDQISCSLGVEPVGFYNYVREKKIQAEQSELDYFEGNTLVLKNGKRLQPELVVFGTGFRQSLPFLHRYQDSLRDADGQYRLYRNIICPQLKGLGFVGYNSSLFSTLTSEVAANWLVAHVSGTMELPPVEAMQKEVERSITWRKVSRPIGSEFSGTCVAPFNFAHLDALMRDMGLRTQASRNFVVEFFKPINPADYKKLLSKKSRKLVGSNRVVNVPGAEKQRLA
jgi:cation diffusion facilitator CzcD-associated flavoprotein CzcO